MPTSVVAPLISDLGISAVIPDCGGDGDGGLNESTVICRNNQVADLIPARLAPRQISQLSVRPSPALVEGAGTGLGLRHRRFQAAAGLIPQPGRQQPCAGAISHDSDARSDSDERKEMTRT